MALAFEHVSTPVAVTDTGGWIIAANAALCELVGLPRQAILTCSLPQFLWLEERETAHWLRTESAGAAAQPAQFECRLASEWGRQIWVSVDARPLHMPGEGAPAVVVTLSDITKRKRAEQTITALTGQLLRSQDDERQRIANELHGVTAQDLSALIMDLSRVERLIDVGKTSVRAILEDCQALAMNVLDEMRTLSYVLHPPLLDEAGLLVGFQRYLEGFSARSGIAVRFDAPATLERLPRDIEATLFRVLQECLTNIYRHSGSTSAHVALAKTWDHVALQVSDRGRGLGSTRAETRATGMGEAPAATMVGVGMKGMRQWLEQIGGSLEIHSDKRGTTLIATAPRRENGEP